MFAFETLDEASDRFLAWLGGDTREFGVDVHGDGELEEFPLFLSEYMRVTKGREGRRDAGTHHELRCGGTFGDTLFDQGIGEDYLCQFDSEVVFVGSSVLSDGGSDADWWHGDVLPNKLFWSAPFRL